MGDRKIDSVWVPCPKCEGRTHTKVCEDTVLVNFPLFCPRCREVTRIDVVKMKLVLSKGQNA